MKDFKSLSVKIALVGFFLSSGCSLLSQNRVAAGKSPGPVIRDLPAEAREVDSSLRKRILVLPFIDSTGLKSNETLAAAREGFVGALRRGDNVVVVANTDFPKDVSSFLKNGQYDLDAMAKIAASLGVSAVIEGSITEIKARKVGDEVGLVRKIKAHMTARTRLRMINTRNGSVLLDEVRGAEVEESATAVGDRARSESHLDSDPGLIQAVLARAFSGVLPKIFSSLDKLSWEGRVALIKGDRVYLNAGRLSGLQIGDILKISDDGEDVYDPDSGSFIGRVPGRLKGTVEVISYFGKDGAVAVIHSGSGFKENDLVELY